MFDFAQQDPGNEDVTLAGLSESDDENLAEEEEESSDEDLAEESEDLAE